MVFESCPLCHGNIIAVPRAAHASSASDFAVLLYERPHLVLISFTRGPACQPCAHPWPTRPRSKSVGSFYLWSSHFYFWLPPVF